MLETTKEVGILKTYENIIGFNDDENVMGFDYELKTDSDVSMI